jgi:hypothetical protein
MPVKPPVRLYAAFFIAYPMEDTLLRQPLENAKLNEIWVRVCYQLVVYDFRHNPQVYADFPPAGVYDLARRVRAGGFTSLYWTLNGCARWLAAGYTLAAWRNEASTLKGVRAFHKRTGRSGR